MNQFSSIKGERALAQHCAELMRPAPPPAELLPQLTHASQKLARALGPLMAPMMGGETPLVRAGSPREDDCAALSADIAPLAANCLMAAGDADTPLLVSFDAEAVLRLVDRAYGGKGAAPFPLPDTMPLSAELMIARLEALTIGAMAMAFDASDECPIHPLRRDGNLQQLAPFTAGVRLAIQSFTIEEVGQAPWTMTLALPLATLGALCDQGESGAPAQPAQRKAGDPTQEPFADMPLTLSAVLVDMMMPFSAISALEPGQILPVAVARNVPLRIGSRVVAHGTIGMEDDRVAVRITQAF